MRLDDQRRSENIEVRRGGGGRGGGLGGGGLPFRVRGLGLGGIIVIGIVLLLMPANFRNMILGQLMGGGSGFTSGGAPSEVSQSCSAGDANCDFAAAILGSTEDFWSTQFAQGRLPSYGTNPGSYQQPRLVFWMDAPAVESGCGNVGGEAGPFYCPSDNQLYINPSFYDVMRSRLNAPGDFAQAYVIAHEVGHHVQNLIGATQQNMGSQNQNSVRVELQADCFAGAWGRSAQGNLQITDEDLREALNAAHAIGDDTLQRGSRGYPDPNSFTHGTSEQRMRWFRRGFESGDPRQCDTFQQQYESL